MSRRFKVGDEVVDPEGVNWKVTHVFPEGKGDGFDYIASNPLGQTCLRENKLRSPLDERPFVRVIP